LAPSLGMLRLADRGGFSCVKGLRQYGIYVGGPGFAGSSLRRIVRRDVIAPLGLVHGNPETRAVWDHLAPSLEAAGRDPVRLSPPGFGAAVPTGFRVTPAGYRDWLIGELERFAEPADVLGHDWGGVFVLLAVTGRPDLQRKSLDVA
jgi:pimeloyl-ACP methyl ester carboxylesterase